MKFNFQLHKTCPFAFNKYFEDTRFRELQKDLQQKWYYYPSVKRCFSIKEVLPLPVPEMSYVDLEIRDEGTARAAFQRLLHITDPNHRDHIRSSLPECCGLETSETVRLLELKYL